MYNLLILLLLKWGPTWGLLFIVCLLSGYAGFSYSEHLHREEKAKEAATALNHYQKNLGEYLDTSHKIELEYTKEIEELDNEKNCDMVAPDCLRDAF